MKVEALPYDDRRVYSVAAFNRGVASWLERLPTLWVEGEVTELRRHDRWQTVFLTLKDPGDGSCLPVTIPRSRFDALRLDLKDGERVHVFGRPALFEARGDFRLRALSIERYGVGRHLVELERLRSKLAAEGLFADARKRPLPRFPRAVGLVTGNDAAAKHDVLTTIHARFPAAHVVVCETLVQGPRAPVALVTALRDVSAAPGVEVVILARGGGSFEDLLPFSDERVVRAVAGSPRPVVSAVGHEQDTPLCDLAADVRASTPTAAAKLVVPDAAEVRLALDRARLSLARCTRRALERERGRTTALRDRLARGPALLLERQRSRVSALGDRLARAPAADVERRRARVDRAAARLHALSPRATLERGYAIVRAEDAIVRDAATLRPGDPVAVEVASGGFDARVEEVR